MASLSLANEGHSAHDRLFSVSTPRKNCPNRQLGTPDLEFCKALSEVLALLEERSRKQIKIEWQFSIRAARTKLNSHYTRVHPENEKYKET